MKEKETRTGKKVDRWCGASGKEAAAAHGVFLISLFFFGQLLAAESRNEFHDASSVHNDRGTGRRHKTVDGVADASVRSPVLSSLVL